MLRVACSAGISWIVLLVRIPLMYWLLDIYTVVIIGTAVGQSKGSAALGFACRLTVAEVADAVRNSRTCRIWEMPNMIQLYRSVFIIELGVCASHSRL